MTNNSTERYKRTLTQLQDDYVTWRPHYKEISEYTLPRKGRFLGGLKTGTEQDNKGSQVNQRIINGTAHDAIRVAAAGLQGGMTSPTRPWFVLGFSDKDLSEFSPVKTWLHDVRNILLQVLSKSNYYSSVHNIYRELITFGTANMLIEEDFQSVIRCRPFTIGEYYLALDDTYRVDTVYRQFSMTAKQMLERFGEDKVSRNVKEAIDNKKELQRFEIIHAIQPNTKKDNRKRDKRGKAFESVYFEEKNKEDKFLSQSGYLVKPFVTPRWDITGVDVYGGSPGMDALGDNKMLQKMEEKKLKALDKMVDPPMNAPTGMKSQGGTIIAGGVNYYDAQQSGQVLAPVYQINPDIQSIAFEMDRVEQRIKKAFFNELFLTILESEKQMTATEIARRHTDQLRLLGPVLDSLQNELLDPSIDRVYSIVESMGLLPDPPEEIAGMTIEVEYISILFQAQRAVGISGIEQLRDYTLSISPVKPDIVDKMDFEESVEQIGEMLGVPPKIVRADDKVGEIRDNRAVQEQQAIAQEQANQMVQSAKTLSDTKLGEGSALDEVVERIA